jgi:dienelactone hydrolase
MGGERRFLDERSALGAERIASHSERLRSGQHRRARAVRQGALVWLVAGVACVDPVEVDPDETLDAERQSPPIAEFDPASSVVPLPNALLMNPTTGRLNVPASCGEQPGSSAERLRSALNQLDGFGTSRQSLVATFDEPIDPASLQGRVALVRLTERGQPVSPPEGPVPIDVLTSSTRRATADCLSSVELPSVVIQPREPLRQASGYAVLIAEGVTNDIGADVEPSVTWALVRQAEPPVRFSANAGVAEPPSYNATPFDPAEPDQLASLRGLDLLWRGHAPLLAALDQLAPIVLPGVVSSRDDVLLAWGFSTQTLSDVFDASIDGSPASWIAGNVAPLSVSAPAAGGGAPVSVEQAFALALPGVPCDSLGCAAIGAVYTASAASQAPTFQSASYLTNDDCSAPAVLTGAFSDPVAPMRICERQLPVLAFVPATPAPATGYPVVLFAHGIGRSKDDLFALAGSLASFGMASVAVDALDHGVRAVRISSDAAVGCDGVVGAGRPCESTFGPSCAPQCFAPLLSADLAVTRDHLRQTVLDHLALGKALAGCGDLNACGGLFVDPARIGFIGHSLGSLIGAVSVANSADVSAAVLNVGGADWLQVLSETETLGIRCPLIDALIAAGVIPGQAWNLGQNPAATCVGDAWKSEPGFLQFASAARWILDPVDAVNYTRVLADGPPVLVGEVVGDPVVPNSATETLATALGLQPTMAAVATSATPDPTPAVLAAGSVWVRYVNLDGDAATMFPGNGFSHGSLLSPAAPSPTMAAPSGELGTLRIRVDGLSFLMAQFGANP